MTSVSESLGQDSKETFPVLIEKVRTEIQVRFARAHQVLITRESDLLLELQSLLEVYTGEEIEDEIRQINVSKESLSAVKGNITSIDNRIKELERKLRTLRTSYKSVRLEWDVSLEKSLEKIGKVSVNCTNSKVPDYQNLSQPLAAYGKHSKTDRSTGVFLYPRCVAIDPVTNYIYICDGFNRIQVFDDSVEFLFSFNELMQGPEGICIREGKVYVTQYSSHYLNVYNTLGELMGFVGGQGNGELCFNGMAGIDVSIEKCRIYVAELNNSRIQCLNIDLTFHSYISHILGPKDVKLTSDEVIVLCHASPCLIIYNYEHQSIRHLIFKGAGKDINFPAYLFVDQVGNFLITDYRAGCVRVFSHGGDFIHQIGEAGEERGQFINPNGLVMSNSGKIVVVSANVNHAIQIF